MPKNLITRPRAKMNKDKNLFVFKNKTLTNKTHYRQILWKSNECERRKKHFWKGNFYKMIFRPKNAAVINQSIDG